MGSARKARENAVDQNHVEDASTIACSTSSSVDVAVFRDRCWTLTCGEQKRRLLVLLSYPLKLPGIASTPARSLKGQNRKRRFSDVSFCSAPKAVPDRQLIRPPRPELPPARLGGWWTRAFFATNQQQVAGVHEQSERLACDEDRVSAMDRVSKECHSACQTKIPEGDRDDTAPLALALDPLPEKAHHEQELSQEANSDPHHVSRAERVQVRSCGFEQARHLPRSPTHCGRRGWANRRAIPHTGSVRATCRSSN